MIDLTVVLTPLIVFLATEVMKKVSTFVKSNGLIVISVVVPLLSLSLTYVSQLLIAPDLNFWAQAGYGLLAVFVNELIKQIKSLKQ